MCASCLLCELLMRSISFHSLIPGTGTHPCLQENKSVAIVVYIASGFFKYIKSGKITSHFENNSEEQN